MSMFISTLQPTGKKAPSEKAFTILCPKINILLNYLKFIIISEFKRYENIPKFLFLNGPSSLKSFSARLKNMISTGICIALKALCW